MVRDIVLLTNQKNPQQQPLVCHQSKVIFSPFYRFPVCQVSLKSTSKHNLIHAF